MRYILTLLALLVAVPAGASQWLVPDVRSHDMDGAEKLMWVTNTHDLADPAALVLVRTANGVNGSREELMELALRRYLIDEPNTTDLLWKDDQRKLVGLYKRSLVLWSVILWVDGELIVPQEVSPAVGEHGLPMPVLLSVEKLTDWTTAADGSCECPLLRLVVKFTDDLPGVCRHEGPNPASIVLSGECRGSACTYGVLSFDAADLAGGRP